MKHLPDTECALAKFGRGGTAVYCTRCHRTVSVRDPGRCDDRDALVGAVFQTPEYKEMKRASGIRRREACRIRAQEALVAIRAYVVAAEGSDTGAVFEEATEKLVSLLIGDLGKVVDDEK